MTWCGLFIKMAFEVTSQVHRIGKHEAIFSSSLVFIFLRLIHSSFGELAYVLGIILRSLQVHGICPAIGASEWYIYPQRKVSQNSQKWK